MKITPNKCCPECAYFEEYDAHLHINGNHNYCTFGNSSGDIKHCKKEPVCIDGYFRSDRKCECFNR